MTIEAGLVLTVIVGILAIVADRVAGWDDERKG